MAATTTTDQFLDLLRKSQLLTTERIDEAMKALPVPIADHPKKIAEHFVHQGLLTPFQAGLVFNGKWRGFMIAGGKYKLLQLLGVGGMGKVYLCEHVRMKRLVALKILPSDQLKDPGAVERFNREAVAAASLNHPNIVKAFDVDQDGTMHFLVMEYVDGSSLHEIVKKHGAFDVPRTCHYIAQAASGLQHAHEQGWIHRDIKPGNLLLDRHGTVKILDMGLARYFHADSNQALTQQLGGGAVLGTADYLSPEQAVNSSDVDIRSDIYSLGATLYFLLVGKAPFEAGTVTEKLLAHQLKEPEPITSLRPDTPKALDAVLKKMMAKKPVHRFQTPAAVAEALAPWTAVPIEPPAPEEMPRLSAALGSYASGVPSGPISSISQISGARSAAIRGTSSNYLLRKPMSGLGWLQGKHRTPILATAAAFAGVLAVSLIIIAAKIVFGGGEKPAPTAKNPPVVRPEPSEDKTKNTSPPTVVTQPPSSTGTLNPAQAAQHVGDKVTVEFVVNSTGGTRDGHRTFLNSTKYEEKDNFTIVLDMKKVGKSLEQSGISDPKNHYKGKTVRVTGTVALFKDSPQIVVDDLKQIEEVNK